MNLEQWIYHMQMLLRFALAIIGLWAITFSGPILYR